MSKVSKRNIINRIKNGSCCCPICGVTKSWATGNMAEYPERWEQIFCIKCGQLVCISDNSPYVHVCEDIRENIKLLSYKNVLKFVRNPNNDWKNNKKK